MRLDFILVSESLINSSIDADIDSPERNEMSAVYSSVDININTNTMSDHYPIYITNKHEKTSLY